MKPKQEIKHVNRSLFNKDHDFHDAYMALFTLSQQKWSYKDCWLADSGASNHMTFRRDWFMFFQPINDKSVPITIGNNDIVYAKGRGNIKIVSTVNGKKREDILYNVFWIPDLSRNLFSIGASNSHSNKTIFEADQIKIVNRKGQTIMIGCSCERNLCTMDTQVVLPKQETQYVNNEVHPLSVWHERLGHVNYKKLEQMIA